MTRSRSPLFLVPRQDAVLLNECGGNALPLQRPFWRWGAIAIAGFPLVVALAVSRLGVAFPFPSCWFQALFGFPAPSCGLTRSFLALARGDWAMALEYHLFGPVLAGLFGATVGVAALELLTGRSRLTFYQRLLQPRGVSAFVILLLVYYGLRLWARYTLPTLPWGWSDTVLWQHFRAGALAI